MKRKLILIFIFFSNIINAYSFAETDSTGMDMELYTTIAGYAFLVFVVIMFSILMYYSHRDFPEPVKIEINKPLTAATGKLSAEVFVSLNRIYYSVIILLVIYLFALILLMF